MVRLRAADPAEDMTLERYLLRRFDSALDRLEAERAFALPDAPEPTARTDEPR